MTSASDTAGPNPGGMCMCGCGEPAAIAKRTRPELGHIKGLPCRYASGHPAGSGKVWAGRRHTDEARTKMSRALTGAGSGRWRGGNRVVNGRRLIWTGRDHPMADPNGYVRQHRLIASAVIGRHLRSHEHVHHINCEPLDNRPANLVLVTNSQHQRIHALIDRGMDRVAAVVEVCGGTPS